MTLAEKLIFLANRTEDGRKFYISTFTNRYFFNEDGLIHTEDDDGFVHKSGFKIDTLLNYDFTLKKPIVFTEDERAILRNLHDEFQWITRDKYDELVIHTGEYEPFKVGPHYSVYDDDIGENFNLFKHLFQCIQWTDDEPCEFRKYI